MNRKWLFRFSIVAGLLGPVSIALAQPAQPIELKGQVKVVKVTTENGRQKTVLVDPNVVVPGDRLVFTTSYRNTGAAAVSSFVVTNPLPEGVTYAPTDSSVADVSVDSGKTWGKLDTLRVADGKGGFRPAVAADVTHLRWILPLLASGAAGSVTYLAVVR